MTSSLVGSEMCIRDSREEGRDNPRGKSWYQLGWIRLSTPGWSSSWTVSYTHLTLPTICSV
eukprot:4114769-Prorocentrum_lima.AAC.1